MKKILFQSARFIASCLDEQSWRKLSAPQGRQLPEIALVGRSNVGKSSLINHLLKHNTLARVSSTPGKTQTINFFSVDEELIMVDLPGYGFAKVSKELKKDWGKILSNYLETSKNLSLVLLLLDSRRLLAKEDLAFIQWSLHHRKSLLLVFTKIDKLSSSEKHHQMQQFRRTMMEIEEFSMENHLYFSIKESSARQALIQKINEMLYCDRSKNVNFC